MEEEKKASKPNICSKQMENTQEKKLQSLKGFSVYLCLWKNEVILWVRIYNIRGWAFLFYQSQTPCVYDLLKYITADLFNKRFRKASLVLSQELNNFFS